MTTRFALAVPPPFDLALVLTGHGWYDLAPHQFDAATARFTTVVVRDQRALDVAVTAAAGRARPDRVVAANAAAPALAVSVGGATPARA
ncbi:MAG: hypothetical protein FJ293_08480, partial [Planctomycetes bacterium]|nr:hypothetical protein [Planctomycetota bacterium]